MQDNNKMNKDMNTIEVTSSHLILKDGFIKHLEAEEKEEEERKSKLYSYSGSYGSSYSGGYYSGGYNGCNNYCRSNPTYGYSGSVNYDKDRCCCRFYEWSNLGATPMMFSKGKEFFQFLDECKIKYEESDKRLFNTFYDFYATCKKGKAELLLTRNYKDLQTILDKTDDDD